MSDSTVFPLSGVRVLVLEDNADCRDGVVACLELVGADVSSEGSGNGGFDTFLRERPDVIISDIYMPDGDGYGLISTARISQIAIAYRHSPLSTHRGAGGGLHAGDRVPDMPVRYTGTA